MDEYERASADLIRLLKGCSGTDFLRVYDPNTPDPDCRSVATIMHHVIRSGYGYANRVRERYSMQTPAQPALDPPASAPIAIAALNAMLVDSAALLAELKDVSETDVVAKTMTTPWGQTYDLEQLMEHAIVHVLRHRRQCERFLQQPAT